MRQDERDFLKGYDPSVFPPAAVATDVAVFTLQEGKLKVLLLLRAEHPFQDAWGLPGGFLQPQEDLAQAASRVLAEETGARGVYLEQLSTFGRAGRDPRMRVVSVAYTAFVPWNRVEVRTGRRTREVEWFPAHALPRPLAFDHAEILSTARARLRAKLEYSPVALEFLPARFTLGQLQGVYEAVLGRAVDKRNFRQKVLKARLVRRAPGVLKGRHPPAAFYEAGPGAREGAIYPPFRWDR